MNKFLLICFLITQSFAYYDFGVVGNTYDIKESDALKEMKKAYEKIDKQALKKELLDEMKKNLSGNIHLPFCKKNSTKQINLFNRVAQQDIDIPQADIHIKAGTPLDKFYINVSLEYILINATSADEFAWLKNQKIQNIIISEGDLNDLKQYSQKYVLNKTLQNSFGLSCTPSIFEIKNGILSIYEYEIPREEKKK